MKILMCFIDMLRPNLQNLYDESIPATAFDEKIRTWGGQIYTNCYTPSPDTPRSSGCLWSSCYPSQNGCDTRLKYPGFYLKSYDNNFVSLLYHFGYELNYYVEIGSERAGLMPKIFTDNATFKGNGKFEDFLSNYNPSANSLTFLYFPDYHMSVDEYNGSRKAKGSGNKWICDALDLFEKSYDINDYDLIIIFSDHGWRITGEDMLSMTKRLGDGRDQIFMYVKRKGDNAIRMNKKLCSIMDIGPTICDYVGIEIPYAVEGISLLSSNSVPYILVEDYRDFSVDVHSTVEFWGIRTMDGLACVDEHLLWESTFPLSEEVKTSYEILLKRYGSFFEEHVQLRTVLEFYDKYTQEVVHWNGKALCRHLSCKRIVKSVSAYIKHLLSAIKQVVRFKW